MKNKMFSISGRAISALKLPVACGVSLMLFGAVAQTSNAASASENVASQPSGATEIKLVMGAQHELNLPAGVERIAIGDDTVAGVHIKSR